MGCPSKAKLFNPQLKKLDAKTVSCHFIGYPDKSKGYRFYCPDRFAKFVETNHAVFLEDVEIRGSSQKREINFEEIRANLPVSFQETIPATTQAMPPPQSSGVAIHAESSDESSNEQIENEVASGNQAQEVEPQPIPQPVVSANEPLRRSQRERRSAIPDYFETYISEDMYDIGKAEDPTSFKEVVSNSNSAKWVEAMKDELKSMSTNDV